MPRFSTWDGKMPNVQMSENWVGACSVMIRDTKNDGPVRDSVREGEIRRERLEKALK